MYNVPVRLRLVVLAPAGAERHIDPHEARLILERIVPRLGSVVDSDFPRIRVWPGQLSHKGFSSAFHRHTRKPDPEGAPLRWILVAGRARIGKQPVLVGLGLWADKPNTMGRITLDAHQWMDVLRVS